MTSYKFFKHKNGISSFAALSVELANGSPGNVEWADGIVSFESIYGDVVKSGIRDALKWHTDSGGAPAAFRVLEFTELVVDTRPDAVRCAATGAAWKELGHDDTEILFEHDTHEWKAQRKV